MEDAVSNEYNRICVKDPNIFYNVKKKKKKKKKKDFVWMF